MSCAMPVICLPNCLANLSLWRCRQGRGHPSSESTYECTSCYQRPTSFPLPVGAPLAEFETIAGSYPVYRIDLYETGKGGE